jgi:integrase
MDGDVEGLRAQIAALTAAIQALDRAPARRAPTGITFNGVAERYAKRVAKPIMYTLAKFLMHFGEAKVAEARKADYLHWRDELRAHQPTCFDRPPSVGTLNQELRQVHAMLRWAVAAEVIDGNPFEGIKFLKGQRPRETEIDPEEDAAAFSDAPLLVRAYQAVCADTGARSGCEVRLLERGHIDKARSLLVFPRKNTKGQVMKREVPVTGHTLELLAELPAVAGTTYVFANPRTRKAYSRVHLTMLCRPFLDRLTPAPGDGRVVTHDRRHTRVSRLARDGMNPMASMKLIGHKTPAMHWRYLHVSDQDRAKMKAMLEAERAAMRAPRRRSSDV